MEYLKKDEQSGRLYFDMDTQDILEQGQEGQALILEKDIGVKMLFHNRIEGIVSINCQHIDEKLRIYYETDGMHTLQQRYHDKTMTVMAANKILQSLLKAIESTELYFMEKEKMILSEEYVFLCGEGNQVRLCYYPLAREDVYDGLKKIMEFLMKHIEHNNRKEIAFFYGLHNMILEKSVTLEEMAEYLKGQETSQRKSDAKPDKNYSSIKEKRQTVKKQDTKFHCLVRKTDRVKNKLVSLAVPKEIPLQGDILSIGRKSRQDINLIPAQISREHAVIYCEGDSVQIEDKNSLNGTYINGRKISAYVKVPCRPGDVIAFADIPYELV